MTSKSAMKERLRLELGDFVQPFQASFTGDGETLTWSLPHENIAVSSATPFDVRSQSSGEMTGWTLDAEFGLLTFAAQPSEGEVVVVDGYHAEIFSDKHLESFLSTAFSLHNVRRNPPVDYASVDGAEEYALILKGKVQALWVLAADAARDIDIITVEGVRVPRSQRFQQLMVMLRAAEQQYDELADNLNVGVDRMEQLTLRRTSRLTNRLVPVYLSQEVDDRSVPTRVFPPIDTQGADLPIPTVEEAHIQVYQGRAFSTTLVLRDDDENTRDLTGYSLEAVIYRGPYEEVELDRFNVVVENAVDGEVSLKLTKSQTRDLEKGIPYVYLFKIWDETGAPTTVRKGHILVETDEPAYLEED